MSAKNIRILAIIVGVIVPVVVIMLSAFFLTGKTELEQEKITGEDSENGYFTPTQILSNKMYYSSLMTTSIKGQSASEPVVCKTISCPEEDQCCGCPETKNIIIKDLSRNSKNTNVGSLTLLNRDGSPACHRVINTCNYDCGDWEINTIYTVDGKFYADPPPPGWMLSLDYYFLVDNKNLEGEVPVSSSISNFLLSVRDYFGNLFSSGSYVLQ